MTQTPQPESPSATQPWLYRHSRLAAILLAVFFFLLLLVVPPFISIRGYKKHIAQLVSASLGRPVQLSSVRLRMLPRPGFVLTNLTVDEDPAFGAEPVLHASTVVAYIRLWSLWQGHLSLDKISVDEASLNLVRAHGRWNVDSLFRTPPPDSATDSATGSTQQAARQPLPYLEATDSRINIKSGAEKLPFSLTSTDASLWQEGDAGNISWHIRLRGQPVRTDLSLDPADTGIVRLEATLQPRGASNQASSPASNQDGQHPMPLDLMQIHLDLDWREAQLGQLSRLILGSDEDWRGDLTGEIHLDGTAESAKVTARLRATGVHRAEFQPAEPLDFDATCAFVYHAAGYETGRALEKIACNSPIGQGRVHLTGDLPAAPARPHLVLELDHVPAQAPIDLLRTLRGNLDQGLSAEGDFSGKMTYAPASSASADPPPAHPDLVRRAAHTRKSARPVSAVNPLTGVFTAEGVKITGDGISAPIELSKITVEPAAAEPDQIAALAASVSIPAGAPSPLAVNARLMPSGFAVAVRGPASLARLRELANAAGITQSAALGQITGDPASLDIRIEGAWLANPFANAATQSSASPSDGSAKKLSGSLTLHNAAWKPEFLASPVDIASATLHFQDGELRWNPVEFTYGPAGTRVKGSGTLSVPAVCTPAVDCTPHFTLHFASLNAAELQSALLGAKSQGTLLSTLLNTFRSNPAPNWPELEGSIQADSFTAGVFPFTAAAATVHIEPSKATITAFNARIFNGEIRGTGTVAIPATQSGKPAYKLNASFAGVNPVQAGQLIGQKWKGGELSGSGALAFSGFAAGEIAATVKGNLHFDWRHGAISTPTADPALTRFDYWTGVAKIGDSDIQLGENQLSQGFRKQRVLGGISITKPPAVRFTSRKDR